MSFCGTFLNSRVPLSRTKETDSREEASIEPMTFLDLENHGQRGLIQVVGFSFAEGSWRKVRFPGNANEIPLISMIYVSFQFRTLVVKDSYSSPFNLTCGYEIIQ